MFDPQHFITDKLREIDASGIRRVFDLAAKLKNPINLSIGQPDFDVPAPIKAAAITAIEQGHNRYTVTQGLASLHQRIDEHLKPELPHWDFSAVSTLVTSGVSGGLMLALMTTVGPGDEVLIPDPYFVMYRHLVTLTGATAVYVDTYPDFQISADKLEPYITDRTKLILFNTPSNPTGVVATNQTCKDVVTLAEKHNLLILSDEIYDEFCYEKIQRPAHGNKHRCPSPADYSQNILLLRGYSKTYGMTGWRLGYAVGPKAIIEQMTKLQQYSFVCAPSMVQLAGIVALDIDMQSHIDAYEVKRDLVIEKLSGCYELTTPGGAFYAFPKVPEHLGLTGTQFVEKAVDKGMLMIPGNVFSNKDTHFRISYACDTAMLTKGLDLLVELAK
ncbi:MAG: aminotransferase class I/II-fold pyridoxal phosphate-dependent enzyme [Phycisphaeraceae bacterium]|nr:aminotransferase class I/II-fold pyridoxal phosphate-dependent enzyme [Phycisphaeraceae bacterium]